MKRRQLIASMFHRRLVLLFAMAVGVMMLLGGQLVRLAVVEGSQRLAEAEKRLDLTTYLPTVRGRILDRRGNRLALDRPSYDVAVHYSVITGAWALEQAKNRAETKPGRDWDAMSPEQREAAVLTHVPQYEQEIEDVWQAICALGEIDRTQLNQRLDRIKREVQLMAADYWDRLREARLKELIKFGKAPTGNVKVRPKPIHEQTHSHVLLPHVSDDVAFVFRRIATQRPGMISVQSSHRRDYPWLTQEVLLDRSTLPTPLRSDQPIKIKVVGVADHILGAVRDEVWAADLKRRPFVDPTTSEIDLGGYRLTSEVIGSRGMERVFENHLRGTRGVIRKRKDTGEEIRQDHEPGADLVLTLDVVLQARIQAIMSPQFGLCVVQPWQENSTLPVGTPLNGAAVVIEVETGEILAMVSMPTRTMAGEMDQVRRARNGPFVNRPIQAVYPPGSIIKPFVLAAAVTEDVYDLYEPIPCTGHFYPEFKHFARCWIYRDPSFITHGALVADEALARSCNIFFYTMAKRLGIDRLLDWYRRFGLGRRIDIGLAYTSDENIRGEARGMLPGPKRLARLAEAGETRSAAIFMGIGQGPITWTPVQAANAYATLARGGAIRDATLLRDEGQRSASRRSELNDLHLDQHLVETIMEGLRQSVQEPHGTGYRIRALNERIINAQGVTVWAKTGTAQASPWRAVDTNGDGKVNSSDEPIAVDTNFDGQIDETDLPLENLDHAWFVGLVGPKTSGKPQPQYAIVVIVEYGGSGGKTAGPVANQIIHALQLHGYLPSSGP